MFSHFSIGYPVTTLGFGFKSYVGYRIRQRKQREVAKENEFYMQLLQQALPQEDASDDTTQADFSVDLQKELSITTTASSANNSFSNHHKNAQNSSKTLNLSGMSNGSAVIHVSTPNGGVHQSSHKNSHRRSLDKDRGGGDTPNSSGRALSSDSNAMSSKMSYHQNHSYKDANKSSNSDSKCDRGEKETIPYRNNREQNDKDKQNCGYDLQNSVTKSVEFKTSVNGKHASGTDSPHSKNDGSKIHNSNNSLNHMDYSVDSEKSSISLQSNASATLSSNKQPHLNGGIVNYDHEINNETTTEVTEKTKGETYFCIIYVCAG